MQYSILALLIIALLAANLPFVSDRVCGVFKPRHKHFGWHLLELCLCYLLVGVFAYFLETRAGPWQTQNWPFYAATSGLFCVFAFPGFIVRYFWIRHTPGS